MRTLALTITIAALLAGCSGPRDTVIPTDPAKLDSIKQDVQKLSPEDQALLSAYMVRRVLQAAFTGGDPAGKMGVPAGTTIGAAIDEQKKFIADQKLQEAKEAALKAELSAKREAAMKQMRDAVTVALVSKEITQERGYSGIVMDEFISIRVGYQNNTQKPVSGVKGILSITDLFGDRITEFAISMDDTIDVDHTVTWTGRRSVKFPQGDNDDRKLVALEDAKYKVTWNPEVIVFADGSKMELPPG
ncbi:hypothetical protein [Stenotrophomonas sp. 24(2023)]|uniref:hypothetical protein n=1 Tax=Stenotrophomonas sp. 24(2023) TaxID=3068324 RepID=UPI0027E06584|nr:hypothetical protein [Stenotrophomonas sp. 24(2023)]WMJ68812.1 hypothetical protein Q9R17_16745 [Stenotrophomonas sp. 24(2023)]